eukprot:CAMPEP_0197249178 /NCGR_PEP_ID=MMETSP1429-20130617/45514_1 /TAXON_ID=49237 /ORGANISM="Chaetoceros  sp., Strain UNC1202" /LENGTH=363 /DNA_ID=CAMNT_0042710625 /DNA_START=17 /DNA_END=1108 /DNA_ORIENTATION=+
MKFCKNLQQIVEISDPEWAPYWTNYKMLKKLIKELPSLVPNDEDEQIQTDTRSSSPASVSSITENENPDVTNAESSIDNDNDASTHVKTSLLQKETKKENMGKRPGEIAFFKLLHSELKKAAKFFDNTKREFSLREERVRDGMEITKKSNSIMVPDKWSTMAKSIYRLYKDLLLLELYAIMTYCSFSKILKKHDKVTGYDTRIAFMAKVVNKANFKDYPEVLTMIRSCETMFEEVSEKLMLEGNSALCEDERLFISMIHRFYGQIMDKAAEEGAPDLAKGNFAKLRIRSPLTSTSTTSPTKQKSQDHRIASSLRSLVEENDASGSIDSNGLSDEDDSDPTLSNNKRPNEMEQTALGSKRMKGE